jgi:hypothetical protein
MKNKGKYDVTMTMLLNQLQKNKNSDFKKHHSELISKLLLEKEKKSEEKPTLWCLPRKKKGLEKKKVLVEEENMEKKNEAVEELTHGVKNTCLPNELDLKNQKRAEKEFGKLLLRKTSMGKEIYLCYK